MKVYHLHSPFTPPTTQESSTATPGKLTPDSNVSVKRMFNLTLATVYSSAWLINFPISFPLSPLVFSSSSSFCLPRLSSFLPPSVYTSGGGTFGAGFDSEDGKRKFVSYDTALGSNPGMTTCASCQQQVMTNVTYKAGTYAWLMCLLFICCG